METFFAMAAKTISFLNGTQIHNQFSNGCRGQVTLCWVDVKLAFNGANNNWKMSYFCKTRKSKIMDYSGRPNKSFLQLECRILRNLHKLICHHGIHTNYIIIICHCHVDKSLIITYSVSTIYLETFFIINLPRHIMQATGQQK